jgi:hypothetical protein
MLPPPYGENETELVIEHPQMQTLVQYFEQISELWAKSTPLLRVCTALVRATEGNFFLSHQTLIIIILKITS